MFKDYKKYLSASLKVYLFVLVCVLIMKIVGLDYFGLDMSNSTIKNIDSFLNKYYLLNIWYLISYYIYTMVIIDISLNRKINKLVCLFISCISLLNLIFIKPHMNSLQITIFDFAYLYIIILILNKFNNKWKMFKRYICLVILNIMFQAVSLFVRNVGSNEIYIENSILWLLINLDYIILSIISYKIYFMKGDNEKWVVHISSSLKKISLKKSLKQLQEKLHKFKQLPKVERLSIIIYIILSLIWNTLSLVIILIVANLNHTFIECIFILTSFWLSKRTFGKPFHLSSMAQCFVVSNLTYYGLNRITTPLGISMFVPILLGVGLSYVTSKFVKKTYKPLYKGMPEELFEETILKVTDKDSIKYNVCYDFYIKKESDISLSFKYNYSVAGIRKIKDRINQKIKELK